MINDETIAKMKDGVVIINTARGKCVVEDDLAAALASGKVRAYATDVWYSDPPDASSPLYRRPQRDHDASHRRVERRRTCCASATWWCGFSTTSSVAPPEGRMP